MVPLLRAGGGVEPPTMSWHAKIVEGITNRADWLDARRLGIGASDVAAIVGLSPWASAYSVWADKTQNLEDEEPAEWMRWGNLLEDAVLKEFEFQHGLVVADRQLLVHHPDLPWAMATVDGLAYEGPADPDRDDYYRKQYTLGVVEAKTDSSFGGWVEVPDHYRIQVQWQLFVTGLEHAWIAVLHGGRNFKVYEDTPDPRVQSALAIKVEKFYVEHVQSGRAPEVDGTEATTRVLADLWSGGEGEADLDPVAAADLKSLVAIRVEKARIEAEEKRLENRVKAALGESDVGLVNGEPWVTWKGMERKGYWVEPTSFRRFVVNKKVIPNG